MRGKIFADYDRINVRSKKGRQAFLGAIQHFWNQVSDAQIRLQRAGITEFTSKANFPSDVLNIIERYHVDIAEIDTAYEAAFDAIDLTSVKASSFTVRDTQSGLTFSRVRDGDKAKIYSVHGGEVTVALNLYGGGLNWLKTWFDDGEWWTIEDNALEFRRKWFEQKATAFYDMIQSLTNTAVYNVPYDESTGATTELEWDRKTISTGAEELIEALKDSGYGVTAATPMVMLSSISMKSRVEAALQPNRFQSGAYLGGVTVNFNITPYFTPYLDWTYATDDGATKWTGDAAAARPLGYLCVPGRKNKIGNRMDLTLFAETDILSFAETVVGWGRYGAYLNEAQWRRISSIK